MITSIIFSKDRALQLDLTIQSILENLSVCNDVKVIYKTSNLDHDMSYRKLRNTYPKIQFINQDYNELLPIIISAVKNSGNNDICFFTDDNIVFQKCNITESEICKILEESCCHSLRMGLNITHRDYGNGLELEPRPLFRKTSSGRLQWNRMSVAAGGYWNYPLSVDGHIFKRSVISNILHTMIFWPESALIITPNKFEQMLQRFFFEISPLMTSELYSCVVNSPNNRVQNEIENKHGDKFFCDVDSLNFIFSQGKRIDLNKIDFSGICCPHQELDIIKGLS